MTEQMKQALEKAVVEDTGKKKDYPISTQDACMHGALIFLSLLWNPASKKPDPGRELLQDRLTEEANIAKSLKESKRHYEQLLQDEREKHKQELRKVNAEKRKLQDDIFDVILNPSRQRRFLMGVPVHQLSVSNMLRSLLLNAGYDTLGDVVSRPLQQLSRNVVTNQIYTQELKQFLGKVGLTPLLADVQTYMQDNLTEEEKKDPAILKVYKWIAELK